MFMLVPFYKSSRRELRNISRSEEEIENELKADIEKEDREIELLRAKAEERRIRQENERIKQEEQRARLEAEKRIRDV